MESLAATGESTTKDTSGLIGHQEPKPLFLKYPEVLNAQLFEGLIQQRGFTIIHRQAYRYDEDTVIGWFYCFSPQHREPFKTQVEVIILDSLTQEEVYIQTMRAIGLVSC